MAASTVFKLRFERTLPKTRGVREHKPLSLLMFSEVAGGVRLESCFGFYLSSL